MHSKILDGLLYLEELNLGLPELTCSNILLDTSGQVKICMLTCMGFNYNVANRFQGGSTFAAMV